MFEGFLKNFDLLIIILLTLLCMFFALFSPLDEILVRIVLGLPLIFFLPGYSLIAALFPRKDDLDGLDRVTLSFGISIAITSLIGLILNYTPFGITLASVLAIISTFSISLSLIAWLRR